VARVIDALSITRDAPDTRLFAEFDGEPLVQSFAVGDLGRAWITTAEALAVPAFGRQWVADRLNELDPDELPRALAAGLRLRAETRELALAA
jgi:hypothetical protein